MQKRCYHLSFKKISCLRYHCILTFLLKDQAVFSFFELLAYIVLTFHTTSVIVRVHLGIKSIKKNFKADWNLVYQNNILLFSNTLNEMQIETQCIKYNY